MIAAVVGGHTALFGNPAFFDAEKGVKATLDGDAIRLVQGRRAAIALDEAGCLLVQAAIESKSDARWC